jgi:hypothetical protein
MRTGQRPSGQPRLYRYAVGGANIALAAMLFYGVSRYFQLIVPRYGHRFAYVAILMAGIACWAAFRGVVVFFGRSGERGG